MTTATGATTGLAVPTDRSASRAAPPCPLAVAAPDTVHA